MDVYTDGIEMGNRALEECGYDCICKVYVKYV
jgi:hypothetical protein